MFEGFDFSKMGDMIKEAQEKAEQLQNESASKIFVAKSGGGMVSVSINGNSQIVDVSIDDSLLEDKESLQILLISAFNDAIKICEDERKSMASKMLGNLGGFKL